MLSVAPFEYYSTSPDAGTSSLAYKILLHSAETSDENRKTALQKIADADHAFGTDPFDWMPAPHIMLKRPNLQPNATYHVSAIAPEHKPDAIMRAMSKSSAGAIDTSAAPKGKTAGQNKATGPAGLLAIYVAALIPAGRPDYAYNHGYGGRRHLKFESEP